MNKWKLVPVEPTEEIRSVIRNETCVYQSEDELYAAMLEAAPPAPSVPEPEPVADGHVYVQVSGLTGSGKSAVAGEIEIAMRAIGLDVEWVDSESEKHLTHADYTSALELYRPKVRIFEKNISRSAPPAPNVPDWMNYKQGYTDGIIDVRNDLKQLCKDFSCRQDRPYMGDVHAQIDALCDRAIAEFSTKSAAPTPAEAPADVARDAERLDWLDVQCSENNGRHIYCLPGGLRAAIDAAIERQGG